MERKTMTNTTTPTPPSKADRLARGLIGAGALLHTIGGKMLQGNNDQLRDELAAAAARVDELGAHVAHVAQRAYDVGRAHQAAAAPWSTDVLADVAAHPWTVNADELAGDAEHQGAEHSASDPENPALERISDQRVDVAASATSRVDEWAGAGYSTAAPSSSTSTTAAAGQ